MDVIVQCIIAQWCFRHTLLCKNIVFDKFIALIRGLLRGYMFRELEKKGRLANTYNYTVRKDILDYGVTERAF